uniref:Peptidase M55 n=1 Tax=candidate division WOR-3 bacterium TaxID=2052148 RepID=A0A7C6AAY2_UNCW3
MNKKFFISVDYEGIGGTVSWQEFSQEPARFRKLMANEVTAVIEGIREAYPESAIVICDAHGLGHDLLFEELPFGVMVVRGSPRQYSMIDTIDKTFDLLYFVGYHSKAGTVASTMDHTYSSATFYRIKINQQEVDEAMINAAVAGHFGVPLGFVSGDDKLIASVKQVFGKEIETVITKYSRSRFAALTRHPKDIGAEIKAKAKNAALKINTFKPFRFPSPCQIELQLNDTVRAQQVALIPGSKMIDGRTVSYKANNFLDGYKFILLAATLGSAAGKTYQ